MDMYLKMKDPLPEVVIQRGRKPYNSTVSKKVIPDV